MAEVIPLTNAIRIHNSINFYIPSPFCILSYQKEKDMPIYMDRHDLPGVTAKDVAAAHQEDLKIQEQYGCRALTYWFDEERGTAFCLIEAPDKDAVKEMHDKAHGLIPHQIIEVSSSLVEAFLGRIEHPETSGYTNDADLIVFTDPAFRTIMAIALKGSCLMNAKRGITEAMEQVNLYTDVIRNTIKQYQGTEVEHANYMFLISFVSVSQAVECAIEILNNCKKQPTGTANKLQVQISLSAGVPVTDSNDLFGETVQLAKRLCNTADKDQIIVSSVVRNLYQQEGFYFSGKEVPIKIVSPPEEEFLYQLMNITETKYNETEFNTYNLAKQIGVSKSQLYRKITSLTGLAPNDFIKEYRLNKAVKLIEKQQGNIAEIAYESGFTSPSYFSKCFQKKFGVLPSDYATAIA